MQQGNGAKMCQYYKPWDLRTDEEDRIDDQIKDTQDQIDKELADWQDEKQRRLDSLNASEGEENTKSQCTFRVLTSSRRFDRQALGSKVDERCNSR